MKERHYKTHATSIPCGAESEERHNTKHIIEMQEEDYAAVAERLLDRIGTREYFNGTVECAHGEFCSALTATLIIYRSPYHSPLSRTGPVEEIVPVWWEFHTTTPEGERDNDFSFRTLKEYLLA